MEELPPCPNLAAYRYPWAGKIMKGCVKHTNAMANIAQAIGYPMQIEALELPAACDHRDDLPEESSDD